MVQLQFEVCVDSVESALAAESGGADRLELCSALGEGGLTPSLGLMEVVRARVKIPLAVMLRPRAGDFCYSPDEFEVMRRDLRALKERGANMFVFGLLNSDGHVDATHTRELIELARPLPVTFHRAFDLTRDPVAALETLIQLGCERMLTSGQEKSVLEGLELISELVRRAGERIIVVPGGGITERNLPRILRECAAREFHVSASGTRESRMEFRNTRVPMGRTLAPSEYALSVADAARVRRFRDLAGGV
ncbi:MAG TPA: copper homeostasis protein CutC [Verrucomicrobiota bacterium]|nr:copper homeostasis protein CutC [Verrucomicrobiales bacterium]HRI11855.1 copper homeostasis protein CutC [Verrucomicrobiota bacterium]